MNKAFLCLESSDNFLEHTAIKLSTSRVYLYTEGGLIKVFCSKVEFMEGDCWESVE